MVIRKYGDVGTKNIMKVLHNNSILKENSLSAIAHLIHGRSEDWFNITYCPALLGEVENIKRKVLLLNEDIECVGYEYGNFHDMHTHYNLTDEWKLHTGWLWWIYNIIYCDTLDPSYSILVWMN